jgi:hypothetical protein
MAGKWWGRYTVDERSTLNSYDHGKGVGCNGNGNGGIMRTILVIKKIITMRTRTMIVQSWKQCASYNDKIECTVIEEGC